MNKKGKNKQAKNGSKLQEAKESLQVISEAHI